MQSLFSICRDALCWFERCGRGYDLPDSAEATPLPSNLNEAILAMESSELVRETLGEHVFEYVLRNKRAEWNDYSRQVTAYELDRYLPIL